MSFLIPATAPGSPSRQDREPTIADQFAESARFFLLLAQLPLSVAHSSWHGMHVRSPTAVQSLPSVRTGIGIFGRTIARGATRRSRWRGLLGYEMGADIVLNCVGVHLLTALDGIACLRGDDTGRA